MNELLNEYADMTYSDYESHIQGIVDSITKGEKQDQYLLDTSYRKVIPNVN